MLALRPYCLVVAAVMRLPLHRMQLACLLLVFGVGWILLDTLCFVLMGVEVCRHHQLHGAISVRRTPVASLPTLPHQLHDLAVVARDQSVHALPMPCRA